MLPSHHSHTHCRVCGSPAIWSQDLWRKHDCGDINLDLLISIYSTCLGPGYIYILYAKGFRDYVTCKENGAIHEEVSGRSRTVSTPCQSSLCLVGSIGQNITLPCWHNGRSARTLTACWGRERVPMSKCSRTIVSIQGGRVTGRASPRYVLLSGREEGNVSLTILHARESDSGEYGCRVEIPGWFNDLKINIHLTVDSDSTLQHESQQKSVAVASARPDPIAMSTARPRDKVQEILTTLGVKSESLLGHQGQQKVTVLLMHSAKTAAIFLIPLAVILVFILGRWRRQRLEMTPGQEENIYEDIQSFAR